MERQVIALSVLALTIVGSAGMAMAAPAKKADAPKAKAAEQKSAKAAVANGKKVNILHTTRIGNVIGQSRWFDHKVTARMDLNYVCRSKIWGDASMFSLVSGFM